MNRQEPLVCVLCGEPWEPAVKNRCECGGMCSWGPAKGADPDSWIVADEGEWHIRPIMPVSNLEAFAVALGTLQSALTTQGCVTSDIQSMRLEPYTDGGELKHSVVITTSIYVPVSVKEGAK